MTLCDAHGDLTSRLDRMEKKTDEGFKSLRKLIVDQQEKVGDVWGWKIKAAAFVAGASWLASIGYIAYKVAG